MLWDRPNLSFDEVPSLQDALRECDRDLLARVVLADHLLGGRPFEAYGKKRVRAMRRRLGKTIDELCEMEVSSSVGEHEVLLPQELFSLCLPAGFLRRDIRAALVSLDDARAVECARVALGQRAGTHRAMRQAQKRARRRVRKACGCDVPAPKGYSQALWKDTLACKVWLGNGLCRRERYMLLSGAVWEMTFYGFSRAEVESNVARACEASAKSPPAACGEALMFSNSADVDLGLEEPDQFSGDYVRSLANRVAVLNHNALIDLYDLQLDLAARCGLLP